MTTTAFAPRRSAAARRARPRAFAIHWERLRRRIVSASVEACAAIARAERDHRELMDMLRLDDRLRTDIGVRRSEILAAVREQRWTRAAWCLMTAAFARLRERPKARAEAPAPLRFPAHRCRTFRRSRRHRRHAVHRLAA
jgi:hypothetical protein